MTERATLFLDDGLRANVERGAHNFLNHVITVLRDTGHDVRLRSDTDTYHPEDGRALTFMRTPPPGGLTFRRVYHYPFWALEPSSERWHWAVAKTPFSPETVTDPDAIPFFRRWQRKLFPKAETATRDGIVYVPLQGRLLQHRSFQTCRPVDMLAQVLAADTSRQVIATLHPKEQYSDPERAALEDLARNPRLTITTGGMEDLLQRCDYVVTMNSSAAFNAAFFGKPAILFGRSDFHHITLPATPDDLSAFDQIADHQPDYARYIYWFWQLHSINAGRADVQDKIRAAMIRGGWAI